MGGYGISVGGYRVEVATAGAGLRGVWFDDKLLTETWEIEPGQKPPLSAGLVLSPWPNRTADGRYTFDGQDHQLEITETSRNNANHGFVRTVDWAVSEQDPASITLVTPVGEHPGYPFDIAIGVTYALDADTGLTVTHTATNVGTRRAPYALGQHTFVRVGDAPIDDCTLQLAATEYLPLDPERQLPAGAPAEVAGTDLDFRAERRLDGIWMDTPFTDMVADAGDGRARHRVTGPDDDVTELWTDAAFGWAQVFTADPAHDQPYPGRGRALAIEPMTGPPNALASGDDLIVLEPGQRWSGSWGLRYHPAPGDRRSQD
ncbi:aldose 1-epimerase family protein [Williamsia sterculiae]|uniref:Aldose 1-epimerase n=1 Tax=Williamsia sterculiae TaxID=1344003 RepID=A0A1N7DEF5_9NOCA|nr:aldose 1-epimerase family protein [Williamsia sterculiae]SIR74135.1 aldose 1-epimerase [Williamsia sterculiae]